MIKTVRAVFRLLYMIGAALWIIVKILAVAAIRGANIERALRYRQQWSRAFLPVIGVRITTRGTPPDFPCIVMCNHRSYLDPVVLVCDFPGMPVSKAEVANWPIVGTGVRVTGTLFLQRDSHISRKNTLQGIADAVQAGRMVVLFPEGTTHDQPHTTRLKRGGFQLAADNGIPIVPVALEYGHAADYWIGDDTFIRHFLDRFGEPSMAVSVVYGEPIRSEDAAYLLDTTQAWMDAQIPKLREELNWE